MPVHGAIIGWFIRTVIKLLIRAFSRNPRTAGQRAGMLIGSEIARTTDSGLVDTAGPGGAGRGLINPGSTILLEEVQWPRSRKKLRSIQRKRDRKRCANNG